MGCWFSLLYLLLYLCCTLLDLSQNLVLLLYNHNQADCKLWEKRKKESFCCKPSSLFDVGVFLRTFRKCLLELGSVYQHCMLWVHLPATIKHTKFQSVLKHYIGKL